MSKVALCVIGRMENRYAEEYVKHYKDYFFKTNKKTKEKEEYLLRWQK